jgi:hypothetical protein
MNPCKEKMKMMNQILLLSILFAFVYQGTLGAMEYPGEEPGTAHCHVKDGCAILENNAIRGKWQFQRGRITSLSLENMHTGQWLSFGTGHMPSILLSSGCRINLDSLASAGDLQTGSNSVETTFRDDFSGLEFGWSVKLKDNENAIIQSLHIKASRDTEIQEILFINAAVERARQVGSVDGSVVVCNNLFLAVEHPLAKNEVDEGMIRCHLPRGNLLNAGQSWTHTSVLGAVPKGQLRRGFLYYLERRRAHPYRPYLHYNNWYNVYLARPVERTNEAECLEAIELFGEKLIRERGVRMDAFVWDDGWDDFNTLWDFHGGFPEGFRNLNIAARKYGAVQGIWMSPWGGYGPAKEKRINFGKSLGYEINAGGFSMAGKKYGRAFRDVCMKMMREHGVTFFKFDGMGGGNEAKGAGVETADDIDAVLDLTLALRQENPEVFISATIGTWPSPFWLFYACSIWRQGGDNGLYGEGDTRQQWITYRDKYCYERIVQQGPLYPLNSLMLGGIIVGDRRSPARINLNEKSLADEIWTFFGSGTNLQELYINPKILTEAMWDDLAAAAKWSRDNSDVLVDTHWIGGDPGRGEVYGWAAWQPGKGIIVLRNPSDSPREFITILKEAFELPEGVTGIMTRRLIYPQECKPFAGNMKVEEPIHLILNSFEVVVIELSAKL